MGRAMRSALRRGAMRIPPGLGFARRRAPMRRSSGSLPRVPRLKSAWESSMEDKRQWPLYEVFIRARGGLDHKHVGSLHAADARMAVDHARDLYTRRQEGVSIWVVPSKAIVASDPTETDSLFEPARDKIYRHPTFYEIPDEVKTL